MNTLDPGRERLLAAERAIAYARVGFAGLATVLLLAFSASPIVADPALAGAAAAAALAYAVAYAALRPYERLPLRGTSLAAFAADGALLVLLTVATGGLGSPFEVAWYLLVLGAALRYAPSTALAAGLACTAGLFLSFWLAGDVALLGQAGERPGDAVARVGILAVAATAGAAVARELARQLEESARLGREMREARTAEARFRGLLQAAPDAIVIVDRAGRIVLVNGAAETTFGYASAEMLGQPVEMLLPARFRGIHVGHREGYAAAPRARPMGAGLELFGRRKDGSEFPVEVSLSPMETEEGMLVTSVIRDVTERKRSESERTTNLERLREVERLRELDAFKTQFINTTAHELGTPLTPIRLQVHMLKTAPGLTPGARKSVEILDRNVERLGTLVQDVLEVARLQAGRLGIQRQAMDLNRVILEAVESFQEPARQAGVALEARLAPDLGIDGDPKRLTQVLFNLLSNAIKFTPRGGTVTVTSSRVQDMAAVHVRDTGVGLRTEDLPRLFQPFSQVGELMRTKGGTGLGLYISRGIVELHGGRAWAQSPGPGQGATFSFAVPVRAPALPERRPEPGPEAPAPEAEPRKPETIAERARELI